MRWQVLGGDCVDAMAAMDAESVDAVVCDPPYGLEFMGSEWDRLQGYTADTGFKDFILPRQRRRNVKCPDCEKYIYDHPGRRCECGGIRRLQARSMQDWHERWTCEALRVLKPGGHLLAFGGTRTYHRLACAVEDAGFEVRDTLCWLYGSGFPKSTNPLLAQASLPRTVTREQYRAWHRAVRTHAAGTALKPGHEPIVLARKPLTGTVAANVLEHGTGALNVDGCRIGYGAADKADREARTGSNAGRAYGHHGVVPYSGGEVAPVNPGGRWPANVALDEEWVPVLRLWDNLSDDAWSLLSEWCRAGNRDLPAVRGRNRRPAESGEAPEVLRPRVPGVVDERESARRGAPDEGATPLASLDQAHERVAEGEPADGRARSDVEGRTVSGAGLLDGEPVGGGPGRCGPRGGDDAEGSRVPARASAGDGEDVGATADGERGGTSRQRDQVGQSAGESGASRRADSQADPRGAVSRATGAARPRVEVLLRDVPEAWLSYFEFTGDVVRVGAAAMLDEQTGELSSGRLEPHHERHSARLGTNAYGADEGDGASAGRSFGGDRGGASRFFYCAKASRAERNAGLDGFEERETGKLEDDSYEWATDGKGNPRVAKTRAANIHPTVKPIDLMRWLVRLVTPPGGLVLDPFAGSGTTGCAAVLEGMRFVGVEREAPYREVARARIVWWAALPQGIETGRALVGAGRRRRREATGQAALPM